MNNYSEEEYKKQDAAQNAVHGEARVPLVCVRRVGQRGGAR